MANEATIKLQFTAIDKDLQNSLASLNKQIEALVKATQALSKSLGSELTSIDKEAIKLEKDLTGVNDEVKRFNKEASAVKNLPMLGQITSLASNSRVFQNVLDNVNKSIIAFIKQALSGSKVVVALDIVLTSFIGNLKQSLTNVITLIAEFILLLTTSPSKLSLFIGLKKLTGGLKDELNSFADSGKQAFNSVTSGPKELNKVLISVEDELKKTDKEAQNLNGTLLLTGQSMRDVAEAGLAERNVLLDLVTALGKTALSFAGLIFLTPSLKELLFVFKTGASIASGVFTINGAVDALVKGFNLLQGSLVKSINSFIDLSKQKGVFQAIAQSANVYFGQVVKNAIEVTQSLKGFAFEAADTAKKSRLIADGLAGFTAAGSGASKGLIALLEKASLLGTVFYNVGGRLSQAENGIISLTGTIIEFIGFAMSPLLVIVQNSVGAIGKFVTKVGTELVSANLKAYDSFIQLEASTFGFNRNIESFTREFGNAIGTADSWNKTIDEISTATGTSKTELRSSIAEIVAATSAMGFNEKQMKSLLRASVDYAAEVHDDVLPATINFIQGLNGSTQSVIKYGVHLGESHIKQELMKDGLNQSYNQLSDTGKAQARFNSLMHQYGIIQGFASDATITTVGTQKLLKGTVENASAAYGRGAAVIENINIGMTALTGIIRAIDPFFLESAGFISALTGRLIQLGGGITSVIIPLTLFLSVWKIVQAALKADKFQELITTDFDLIGGSIQGVIQKLSGLDVPLNSIQNVAKNTIGIFNTQLKVLVGNILKVEAATMSWAAISMTAFNAMIAGLYRMTVAALTNPYILAITAIVGATAYLVNVFRVIEDESEGVTNALYAIGNVFNDIYIAITGGGPGIMDTLSSIGDFFSTVFGRSVVTASKLLVGFLNLLKKLPGNFISETTIAQVDKSVKSLEDLSKNLELADYKVNKLGKQDRTLAGFSGSLDTAQKESKKLTNSLDSLQEKLGKAILPPIDIAILEYKKLDKEITDLRKAGVIKSANEETQLRIKNQMALQLEIEKIELKRIEETAKAQKEADDERKKQMDAQAARLQTLGGGDFKAIAKELAGGGGGLSGGADFSAIGGSIIKSVSDGAKGAESIISGIVTVAATSFLGPIGQVVGQIFDVLAQSPGKLKDMIAEFFKAIPGVISNVIQNIPNLLTGLLNGLVTLVITLFRGPFLVELINSLLNGLGEFVFALISQIPFIIAEIVVGIPQIIQGLALVIGDFVLKIVESAPVLIQTLVNSLPTLIESLGKLFSSPYIISALVLSLVKAGMALIKLMPVVAITMAVELAKNAPTIVTAFIDSFISDGVPQIAHALAEWIEALNPFKNNGDGNGAAPRTNVTVDSNGTPQSGASVSGLLNSIFGTNFQFAQGGMIPSGFPNDSFPARLTSGEFVIDRSLTARLNDYLDRSDKPEQSDSAMLSILQSIDSKIAGQPITIQIGSKTIFAELKDELRSGRVLA